MIPLGNRQYPLRYLRMVTCIKTRSILAQNRYKLAHPIHTAGIEFFKYLCTTMDYSTLDQYKSDVDRYTEVLRGSQLQLRNVVDPAFTNNISGGRLVAKIAGVAPYEVFLNCDCLDPSVEYPFEADWNSGKWQKMRGIRVLYHDSLELPEDFAKSTFNFTKQKPNYLVIGVDTAILRFKYYKYLQNCKADGTEPDIDAFLKDYEFAQFFDDVLNIWLFNLLLRVISSPADSAETIYKDVTVSVRYCTKNMLMQGIEGIIEYADLLRQGGIRPQEFFATKWFGDKSILELLNENCVRWTQIDPGVRHMWLRAMRDIPFFALIVSVVRAFPDTPFKEAVNTRCKELWTTRLKPAAIPSTVTQPNLGNVLRSWQTALEKFLGGGSIPMPFSTTTT